MPAYAFQFGSYTYASIPGLIVEKVSLPIAVRARMADTPGRAGAYSQGGLLDKRIVSLEGMLITVAGDDLHAKVQAFLAAHAPGSPQALTIYSGRTLNAEVTGIGHIDLDSLTNAKVPWSVEFTAVDPYFYGPSGVATTLLTTGGTLTNHGDAPAAPVLSLGISSIGTGGTVTITNTTTGEIFILAPGATGTYTIDSLAEAVTFSGDDVSGEATGVYLSLAPGANVITVAVANGAVVISFSGNWQERFYYP